MRAINMGAYQHQPMYRAARIFPGLGQDAVDQSSTDPFAWNNLDTSTTTEGVPGAVTDQQLLDELQQSQQDQQLMDQLQASQDQQLFQEQQLQDQLDQGAVPPQVTTSETGPSTFTQPSAPSGGTTFSRAPSGGGGSPAPAASGGGTDILSSVGKFFSSLFTPSNVQAAAAAAKAIEQQKAAAKTGPAGLPATVPILGNQVDTGTLLVVGGLAVGAVALIVILKP